MAAMPGPMAAMAGPRGAATKMSNGKTLLQQGNPNNIQKPRAKVRIPGKVPFS